jgi:hypothetical protein
MENISLHYVSNFIFKCKLICDFSAHDSWLMSLGPCLGLRGWVSIPSHQLYIDSIIMY